MTGNDIIRDLRFASQWFTEHGRNTNTAIVGICNRATDEIERLLQKLQQAQEEIEKLKVSTIVCKQRDLIIENAKLVRTNWENPLVEAVKAEAIKDFAKEVVEIAEGVEFKNSTEKTAFLEMLQDLTRVKTEEKYNV